MTLLVPVIGLLGGLAVFLLGLDTLTEALRAQSGVGLRRLMARLTRTRITALLTGVGVTVVLQSSSVTTVLAVGLVSAGIMTFAQSLGIVLGANVGTTVTAQVIAFDITTVGLAMLALGYLAITLKRAAPMRPAGSVLLGLGLVFLGMDVMGASMRPLRDLPEFVDAMAALANPVLGVAAGALFTAVVQSSTAATALAIALAGQGLVELEAGVAIIIGANVGTCVTAGLAAIGKPPEAVRVAVAHVIINLLGAAAWLLALDVLIDWAAATSASYPDLAGLDRLAAETPRQLAMAHTLFNVSTALVLIWFLGPLGRIVERIVPDRRETGAVHAEVRRLDPMLLAAPWAALEAVREEIAELGEDVCAMVGQSVPALAATDPGRLDELAALEEGVDQRYRDLVRYLRELGSRGPDPALAPAIAALLETGDELEAVADSMGIVVVSLGRDRLERTTTLGDQTTALLSEASGAVVAHLRAAVRAAAGTAHDAEHARDLGREASRTLRSVAERLRARMTSGTVRVSEYALAADVLAQLRRVHDAGRRIVRARLRGVEPATQ